MEIKIKSIIDKEINLDIVIELDELEWENQQKDFKNHLEKASEIVKNGLFGNKMY